MVFSYSVQVGGGPPRRGEIEADSVQDATAKAALLHANEGDEPVIRAVFEAPPLHGDNGRSTLECRVPVFRLPRRPD